MSKIETREALRNLYPQATARSVAKVIPGLDAHCRRFIELSPFLLLATCDAQGRCDVSPRGDAAGFVIVDDASTLLLPDRPGNNRLDSLENILDQPKVAVIFLIPGVDETLRVNGSASIHDDPDLLARFEVKGKRPLSVLRIAVAEAYLHCAKALMRSALWDPQARQPRSCLPTMGEMLQDHTKGSFQAESQEDMLKRYREVLY